MKYIIFSIVSFLIGYNFDLIHRSITRFVLRLKYKERKYFEELKIDKDNDFWEDNDFR